MTDVDLDVLSGFTSMLSANNMEPYHMLDAIYIAGDTPANHRFTDVNVTNKWLDGIKITTPGDVAMERVTINSPNRDAVLISNATGGAYSFTDTTVTKARHCFRISNSPAVTMSGVKADCTGNGLLLTPGSTDPTAAAALSFNRKTEISSKGEFGIYIDNKDKPVSMVMDTVTVDSSGGSAIVVRTTAREGEGTFSLTGVTVNTKNNGINIEGTADVTMEDVNITSNGGGHAISLTSNRDETVTYRLADVNTLVGKDGKPTGSIRLAGEFIDVNMQNVTTENNSGSGITVDAQGTRRFTNVSVKAFSNGFHLKQPGPVIMNGISASVTDNGIYFASDVTGDHKIENATISSEEEDGILVLRADSLLIDKVCVTKSVNGIHVPSGVKNLTIRNSVFENFSEYGVRLLSGSPIIVTNNAFLKPSAPRAYATYGANFTGNYWVGVAGDTVYNDGTSGTVKDTATLFFPPPSSCHNLCTQPPSSDSWLFLGNDDLAVNGRELGNGSQYFRARFDSVNWSGELTAYEVSADGASETPLWNASEQIPAVDLRAIYTRNTLGTGAGGGVRFMWSDLPEAQKTLLNNDENLLKYLRGDTSKEERNGGVLRDRISMSGGSGKPLGDMVHGAPWYVADTDTVYAGANDGMLHAFDAATGKELFAYIPGQIFGKLKDLANPKYEHSWFVDGQLAVSPQRSWSGNRNILVGSTGRGAPGLYALDVTTPEAFGTADVLWEYHADDDDDLGHILGTPQIAQLESGDAVVIVGNGYRSVGKRAALYVFDLHSGDLLKKIETGVGGDGEENGMSTPTLVDRNLNGKIDTVYAGDERGNIWRFDFSGSSASAWKSWYGSTANPLPLFVARAPNGSVQPVSAPLTAVLNKVPGSNHYGKRFILFGTGRYVYDTDATDYQVQSLYGLIDDGIAITDGSTSKIGNHRAGGSTFLVWRYWANSTLTVDGRAARLISNATAGDMLNRKGWFIDFNAPVIQGERVVTRSMVYALRETTLLTSSMVPGVDLCAGSGSGYLNAVNPFTGARLAYPPFDLGMNFSSINFNIGMPGTPVLVRGPTVGRLLLGGTGGTTGDDLADLPVPIQLDTGRVYWREVVR